MEGILSIYLYKAVCANIICMHIYLLYRSIGFNRYTRVAALASECARWLVQDAALERRFQQVLVQERLGASGSFRGFQPVSISFQHFSAAIFLGVILA